MLSYKKLDVYKCAIELLALIHEVIESWQGKKGAAFDVASVMKLIDETTSQRGDNLVTRIVEMLTKMCRF